MDPTKPGVPGGVGAGGAAAEGVLASFFNSLLSKKTGAAGSPGGVPGQPGMSPAQITSPAASGDCKGSFALRDEAM